ncbi:MAG TPA: zinc-ribbon domain-containing protein [Anaeromyxobacter sp.]|nr:zinc-ribbon domain-containing protein [Anaeromyxobacter sp.]
MDVRCERCRAQYVFDDEQVTPAGLTVQCTNCGHVFKVKKKELVVTVPVKPDELEGKPLPATAAAPRPHAAPVANGNSTIVGTPPAVTPEPDRPREPPREPPREWRVRQANGNIFTFRELTTLQKWIIEQKVTRDDEISLSGEQWKRLGNIAELASFFQVVEAAERGKAAQATPALTPLPMSLPVYPVALHPPPLYPPPSYAPPPYAVTPSPAPLPEYRPEPLPAAPAAPTPTVEVDLGPEELASVRKGRGGRIALAAIVLLAAAGGAAWFLAPELFAPLGLGPPPADQSAVAVPITIEVKPPADPPPGEAPPPTVVIGPVSAPEPVAQPSVEPPPEPIVKPAARAPPVPRGPLAMLAQAAKLREAGAIERALDLYGRVVDADPGNAEALTGRGLCYLDLESYAPAEASFLAALGIEPDEPGALLGLAETYRWQGKSADAIKYYERYLSKHPGGEEAAVARNALEELRE